jgi:hypothetical protein
MFQSRLEARREPVLLALQNVGEIQDLQYQTPFSLEVYGTQAVDALLEELERHETTPGWPMRLVALARDLRRSREKLCTYKADFTYWTNGLLHVEDTKGFVTPEYRLKKRLMLACHNIEIIEPNVSGVAMRARGCGIAGRGTGSRLKGGR